MRATRQRANRGAIADDPIATAICELVDDKNPDWTGTTGELLELLSKSVGEKVAKSKNWPDQPRALTGRLQKAKAALRTIEIRFSRSSHTRRGTILTITYRAR